MKSSLKCAAALCCLLVARAADAAIFVVNTTDDSNDGSCNASHCSLREAILAANATIPADTIQFAIPGSPGTEHVIRPLTALPRIDRPLTIDGYSQPGAAPNTDPLVSNAQIRVRLDGIDQADGLGVLLDVCANLSVIRGLALVRSTVLPGIGIRVCEGITSNVIITGNFIGLFADGNTAAGNNTGIALDGLARVGGESPADRNVISGNAVGIVVQRHGGSRILGNLIGTDAGGTLGRGNLGLGGIQIAGNGGPTEIGAENAPNRFRFNRRGVVTVASATVSGNDWLHNEFQDNVELAVDLGIDGVSLNDPDDTDFGANGLQNFPIITSVTQPAPGQGLVVFGTLDVPASSVQRPYRLGIYESASCDDSGHGEGALLLQAFTVPFTQQFGEEFGLFVDVARNPAAHFLTMLAVDLDGNDASEFSPCFPVDALPDALHADGFEG